jgi:hypothetical protein
MNTDIGARYISPFLNNINKPTIDSDLAAAYAQLEALKKQQTPQQNMRNVFTDISDEMREVGDDERNFIISSTEYQSLNAQYQEEFSSFLIQYFASDYLKSEYAKTPEKILALIRTKKDQYKSKFANDISDIKTQNQLLVNKNDELEKANLSLQAQLKEIHEKLGGVRNG